MRAQSWCTIVLTTSNQTSLIKGIYFRMCLGIKSKVHGLFATQLLTRSRHLDQCYKLLQS